LYAISVWPHAAFSQRVTYPPSAARATALDRTHHLQLVEAHMPAVGLTPSRTVIAENVRDFQSQAELLPVPYFHVVYTLPSELRDIAYQNKRVVYDLLMKAAAETTLAIAADPLLTAAGQWTDRELRSALGRLVAAGLLLQREMPPRTSFLFKHALVQDTAYSMLLRGTRRSLHARIAGALESDFPT
jgi:hypothetical protein